LISQSFGRFSVAILTMLGFVVIAAPTAAADGTASISGVVTVSTGAPSAVCVSRDRYNEYTGNFDGIGGWSCADATGHYSITDLEAGTYRLKFNDTTHANADEWWNDVQVEDDADPVTVADGAAVTGIDADLSATGSVSGVVTGPGGPVPAGTAVSFVRWTGNPDDYDGNPDYAYTQADGSYVATGLTAGEYRVAFEAPFSSGLTPEVYDDVPINSQETPTYVTVTAGGTTSGISAELAPTGSLSGTVVSDYDGLPIKGVEVSLQRFVPGEGWDQDYERTTDVNGHYLMSVVYPGTYRVKFNGPTAGYDVEYWDNQTTVEAAADVVIASGATVVRDASLKKRSTITGTVLDTTGAPASNVCVEAYYKPSSTWIEGPSGCTDAAGHYEIRGVTPRTYRLHIDTWSRPYVEEYYQDAATVAAATDVVVPAYTAVVRNAVISNASKLHGHVYAPGGGPKVNLNVRLYMWSFGVWQQAQTDQTDSTGAYDFTQLQPGRYKIEYPPTGTSLGEWWEHALTQATATEVIVGADQDLTGYDVTLRAPASISGRVTTPTGNWVDYPTVTVYQFVAGAWTEERSVDGSVDGSFQINGLEPGPRRLRITRPNYVTEYWQDATTLAAGADIPLALGESVTGINPAVAPTITDAVVNDVLPSISGTRQVGSTLTAFEGSWQPATGVTFEYQWLADGVEVPGAVGTSYALTSADLGRRLAVRVTASRPGYVSGSATSAQTSSIGVGTFTTTTPTVTGLVKVGELVTANPGTWSPAPDSYSYMWLLGDAPVANGPTFRIPASAARKLLSLRVTGSRAGFASGVSESGVGTVALGTIQATKQPKLKGKAVVGKTLKVSPGEYAPSAVRIYYDWFVNGKRSSVIKGGELKVTPRLQGKRIAVHVSVVLASYERLELITKSKTVT
jgi:5-hydroxyisourate hydrolase-like protein (transthyretin family)